MHLLQDMELGVTLNHCKLRPESKDGHMQNKKTTLSEDGTTNVQNAVTRIQHSQVPHAPPLGCILYIKRTYTPTLSHNQFCPNNLLEMLHCMLKEMMGPHQSFTDFTTLHIQACAAHMARCPWVLR